MQDWIPSFVLCGSAGGADGSGSCITHSNAAGPNCGNAGSVSYDCKQGNDSHHSRPCAALTHNGSDCCPEQEQHHTDNRHATAGHTPAADAAEHLQHASVNVAAVAVAAITAGQATDVMFSVHVTPHLPSHHHQQDQRVIPVSFEPEAFEQLSHESQLQSQMAPVTEAAPDCSYHDGTADHGRSLAAMPKGFDIVANTSSTSSTSSRCSASCRTDDLELWEDHACHRSADSAWDGDVELHWAALESGDCSVLDVILHSSTDYAAAEQQCVASSSSPCMGSTCYDPPTQEQVVGGAEPSSQPLSPTQSAAASDQLHSNSLCHNSHDGNLVLDKHDQSPSATSSVHKTHAGICSDNLDGAEVQVSP